MKKWCVDFIRINLQMPAGILTLLASLIVITPLCGFLFNCGCTWPLLGLDKNCNYYDTGTFHKCPWCASWIAGGLSVGISVIAGYLVSMKAVTTLRLQALRNTHQLCISVLFGLLSFLIFAVAGAWLSALGQGYAFL